MKDIEQNTALPLFDTDIYKGNITEDSKGKNSSGLVGENGAEMLISAFKSRRSISGPELAE